MKLKRKFSGVATDGVLIQKKRQVVPAYITLKSVAVQFDGQAQASSKMVTLAINGEIVCPGFAAGRGAHSFHPPIRIRPGFPMITVTASQFDDGEAVSGRVVVELSLD